MKKTITILVLAICYLSTAQPEAKFVKNHLIIKIRESQFDAARLDLTSNKLNLPPIDQLNLEYHISKLFAIGQSQLTRTFLIVFENNIDVKAAAVRYLDSGLLDFAEPDRLAISGGQKAEIIPNDTQFGKQWGLYNPGTQSGIGAVTADADVDMELAWDIETGDPEMVIAVSDSGLKLNHPDIAARIWSNTAEIANGIDDDGNGLVDDTAGWDWVNNDNIPADDLGHGSNVAGIIGAIANNNKLFTGVNWNSKLMILKVLDADNSATYSAMASSIYYAADKGAKVFSMSIGGEADSVIGDAVAYADSHNMIFTACTMNFNNNVPYYPAAYSTTHSNVIAVGATNPNDTRTAPFFWSASSGSNYGPHVNVVAPGNYIYGLSSTSDTSANTYWGGTSQATPLVAGIASLILSRDPSLSPAEVRSIIENTAQDQVGNTTEDTPGFDVYMGHGRVNAYSALQSMLSRKDYTAQSQEFGIINPAQNGTLQLFSKGNHPGNYVVAVYAMDGKKIGSNSIEIKSGPNAINFQYPKGNYILALESKGYSKIFKVVVK